MLGVTTSLRWFIPFCILGCGCMAACSLADHCGFLSKEIQIADRIQSITIGDFNNDSLSRHRRADVRTLIGASNTN